MGLRAANLETDVEKLWVEGKTDSLLSVFDDLNCSSVFLVSVCACVFECKMLGLFISMLFKL